MFLTIEDLKVLTEINVILQIDNGSVSKDLIESLNNITTKLEKQKENKNKYNKTRIKVKRETDKYYARSFKEKSRALGI